jgi:uncharacterized repeat protein (TIGR02543 family)
MKKILSSIIVFAVALFVSFSTTYAASTINNDSELSNILDDWIGPEINITYDGIENNFTADIDITDYMIDNDGVTYFVSKDGDNTNDGLTLETAFLTLHEALNQIDVDTIFVDSGIYEIDGNMDRVITNKKLNIIGLDNDVIFTGSVSYAGWTLTSGQTNTYEKTLVSAAYSVRDIGNDWQKYESKTSVAEVELSPGSFYYNSGTNVVYVHDLDSVEPDTDIQVVQYDAFRFTNAEIYMEKINIYAAENTLMIGKGSKAFLNNMTLKYSDGSGSNGLTVTSSNVISKNVTATDNYRDGFNYHNTDVGYTDVQYYVIELDSIAYDNGIVDTSEINNGSSVHEDYQVIRINNEYYNNGGANVHDIGTSISYNFGVKSYDSTIGVDFNKSDLNTSYLFNPIALSTNGISENIIPFEVYYSLTYQTQIASTIYSDFYQENDTVLLPDDPVRTGYAFDGWYEDSTFTTAFELVEMPAERITTYARWIPTPSAGSIISVDSDASLTFLGLAWYWWVAGIGVLYFGFTKKGRKTLGFKK